MHAKRNESFAWLFQKLAKSGGSASGRKQTASSLHRSRRNTPVSLQRIRSGSLHEKQKRQEIWFIPFSCLPLFHHGKCMGETLKATPALCGIALRLHRTKHALRLGGTSACKFSAILHRNSLLGVSPAASFLYNLTKNLTAHLYHQLCAVLP